MVGARAHPCDELGRDSPQRRPHMRTEEARRPEEHVVERTVPRVSRAGIQRGAHRGCTGMLGCARCTGGAWVVHGWCTGMHGWCTAVADAAARLASAIDAVPAWMLDFLRILVAGDSGPTGAVVDPMERGAACTDCGKARLPMLKMLSADERRLPNAAAKPPPKLAAMKPNGKMPPLAGKGNVAVGSEASEVTQAEASNRQPVVEVASVPRPEEQRKVQERDSSNEETEGSAGATISRARQRTAVAPPPVPAPPVTANLAVNFEKATADYDFEATEPDWQLSVRGGDVMNVVEKRDDGWWTVQVLEGPSKGQQGDVPSAYLSIVHSARPPPPPRLSQSTSRGPSPTTSSSMDSPFGRPF